jgi:hypothetical protein
MVVTICLDTRTKGAMADQRAERYLTENVVYDGRRFTQVVSMLSGHRLDDLWIVFHFSSLF